MVDSNMQEQTPGSENIEAAKEETATKQDVTPKTFTEEDLNRIVKDRLERERKKFADYNDLKAAKTKLDALEAAKLNDEEKAQLRLKELQDKIAEKENALKDRALKDLIRDKIEQAISDGRMKLPRGKTIASLVARAKATEESEIDADVEDLIGYFPPDEPSKGIGGGSQQAATKLPDATEQIDALTKQAMDPGLSPAKRSQIQEQIFALKLKAQGGFKIA